LRGNSNSEHHNGKTNFEAADKNGQFTRFSESLLPAKITMCQQMPGCTSRVENGRAVFVVSWALKQ
jgi:hypothetical protein